MAIEAQSEISQEQITKMLLLADEGGMRMTELFSGRLQDGRKFYAYVRLNPSEYMEYKLKIECKEPVDLSRYELLHYGWGDQPSAEVRALMEKEQGVDHGFEAELSKVLQESEGNRA